MSHHVREISWHVIQHDIMVENLATLPKLLDIINYIFTAQTQTQKHSDDSNFSLLHKLGCCPVVHALIWTTTLGYRDKTPLNNMFEIDTYKINRARVSLPFDHWRRKQVWFALSKSCCYDNYMESEFLCGNE